MLTKSILASDAQPIDAAISVPDAMSIDTSCTSSDIGNQLGRTPFNTDLLDDAVMSSCGGAGSADQAFIWTAPTSDYYIFDTFSADFDTVLSIYEECGGQELICNNNVGPIPQSEVVRKFESGAQAILVVDGAAGDRGAGDLNIQRVTCPDIDIEDQSFPLRDLSNTDSGDSYSGDCGGAGHDDRTYHWVAPDDGVYYFHATAEAFKPIVYLLDGPRCADRVLGCNIAGVPEHGAEVVRRLNAGQSVSIVVDSDGGSGLFTLDIGVKANRCPNDTLSIDAPISFADFEPRLLAASCTAISGFDGVGERFDAGDLTFNVTLPGIAPPGRGHCDVIVRSSQEFVLYALDDGDCRGAETDCKLSVPEPPEFNSFVRLNMAEVETQRTVVITDVSPFDSGSLNIETACAAVL